VIIERRARETLTAVEINRGDEVRFTLVNGETRSLVLEDCGARVLITNLRDTRREQRHGGTMLEMTCRVRIDGQPMEMRRYICAQESFYEPYVVNGLRIWFDAVADLFYLIEEEHGPCKPEQAVRFALQDATLSICPEKVHLWCPIPGKRGLAPEKRGLAPSRGEVPVPFSQDSTGASPETGTGTISAERPSGPPGAEKWSQSPGEVPVPVSQDSPGTSPETGTGTISAERPSGPPEAEKWSQSPFTFIDARDCYNGDDCWLGPYRGASAHGGLDINHPAGTPLYAPIALDDQYYYNSVATGYVNNRWRGVRRWPNGSVWALQVAHIIDLTEPEHTPLAAGQQFARGAGVWVGDHEHSHFIFQVTDRGTECRLDPWIIFRQSFEDLKDERGDLRARMAPVSPAKTGEPVTFSPTGSRPGPGGGDLSYFWTFGDGGASDEVEPEHAFAFEGVYPVTLTVEDGVGRASFTQHVSVTTGPRPATHLVCSLVEEEAPFLTRPVWAMDAYGTPCRVAPHTCRFTARPSRPKPLREHAYMHASTDCDIGVSVPPNATWLDVKVWPGFTEGSIRFRIDVDATGLPPGRYATTAHIDCEGANDSRQPLPHPIHAGSRKRA